LKICLLLVQSVEIRIVAEDEAAVEAWQTVINSTATLSNSVTTVLEMWVLGQAKVWLGPHLAALGPPPMD
jgi:hypothetical protein